MAGHNIDVNVNFGSANQNFQTLIDNNNRLQATVDKLSGVLQSFGNKVDSVNNKSISSYTRVSSSIKLTAEEYAKLVVGIDAHKFKIEQLSSKIVQWEKNNTLSNESLKKQKKLLQELRKQYDINEAAIVKYEEAQKKAAQKATIAQEKAAARADVLSQKTAAAQEKAAQRAAIAQEKAAQRASIAQEKMAAKITAANARAKTSMDSLVTGFNSLGAVLGVSFGAYGAFRGLQYGIKVIADFDLANAKLRSILGLTKKDMEDISRSAINLGQSSIFGAKGITELQIELAKMGFAKQEIIDMQEAVINLATATQEDLASSAEVVANIIRAYSLTASDATRVTDVMGKAFNDSALDLANFRESIKYVAPIAAQANFKFEETVAILEQLSNVGLKGSLAGTGLTNIISRLGDANSKFAKTLGRTVSGFDEFATAMIELKSKGADLGDTFELVDRRAAAAFTIILQGVDTIEEFKQKLLEADGVMKQQTAVQLDTIANKWKLMRETINSTILSLDKGDGVFSRVLKDWISSVTNLLNLITGVKTEVAGKDLVKELNIAKELGKNVQDSFLDDLNKMLVEAEKFQKDAVFFTFLDMPRQAAKATEKAQKVWDEYYKYVNIISKGNLKDIDVSATDQINSMRSNLSKLGEKDYFKFLTDSLAKISQSNTILENAGKTETALYKINQKVYNTLNEDLTKYIAKQELMQENAESKNDADKKRLQNEIKILELEKDISARKIDLQYDGYDESVRIANNTLAYDKKIQQKKYELAVAGGQDVVSAQKENNLELEKIALTYSNTITDIWKKMADDIIKEDERLAKADEKLYDDIASNMSKKIKTILKIIEDENEAIERAKKWKKENPILEALGFREDDNQSIKLIKEGFDKAKDYITGWADKWVEQTERVVDARNNLVDEAEQALQTEIQLAEAGFASNVTLRRKELEDAKKSREIALSEAKKARKIQAQIETAEQAGQLASAAANILKGWSALPFVGQALGVAAIASMLGSFIAFRKKAMDAASTDKYEKGGWIGGRLHSQGGTDIEAEKGEFVINRKSAAKHKLMIEAINNDDNVAINRMYINGLKQTALKASVSLDDSEDLKAIRKALERNNKEVTYFGNYRIEKAGNITTKIRVN